MGTKVLHWWATMAWARCSARLASCLVHRRASASVQRGMPMAYSSLRYRILAPSSLSMMTPRLRYVQWVADQTQQQQHPL